MEEDKINYKSASKQLPTLEVPPDLTQIRRDGRYQINGATSALAIANASSTPTSASTDSGIAPNQAGDARIERVGNQRVLIINQHKAPCGNVCWVGSANGELTAGPFHGPRKCDKCGPVLAHWTIGKGQKP
jgi:uncharacterized lipoprotein